MIFIGIDPDVDKNGVAWYDSNNKELELTNLTFFELFDFLSEQTLKENKIKVIIEAGWLNKSNWHKVTKGTSNINTQIGQRTGANHEVGKKIVEMCKYLELPFETIKPTKRKLNHKQFQQITKIIEKRTNQEQRDAGMLVWGR